MRTLAVFHNDRRSLKENCGDIGAKQMASLCARLKKCAKRIESKKSFCCSKNLSQNSPISKSRPAKD